MGHFGLPQFCDRRTARRCFNSVSTNETATTTTTTTTTTITTKTTTIIVIIIVIKVTRTPQATNAEVSRVLRDRRKSSHSPKNVYHYALVGGGLVVPCRISTAEAPPKVCVVFCMHYILCSVLYALQSVSCSVCTAVCVVFFCGGFYVHYGVCT
ncbi:hypothetical protein LSAT2_020817 [Lamellibrachia satsuma]|nr:hypothetical protein LSAT2_020817 [Lamellibrachia satsuma]